MRYLPIVLMLTVISCSNNSFRECKELNLDWNEIDSNYIVRFFRAHQPTEETIDYTDRSCSEFLEQEHFWADLSINEIIQLKFVILDTENWHQGKYEVESSQYLYAGYAIFDESNCLVGKIDLTEAAVRYVFTPINNNVNNGHLNYKGSMALYDLFEALETKINRNK